MCADIFVWMKMKCFLKNTESAHTFSEEYLNLADRATAALSEKTSTDIITVTAKKRAEKTGGSGLEVFKGLKGTIQPTPHIRRGFDEVVEQAVQTVINHINAEIDKIGEN